MKPKTKRRLIIIGIIFALIIGGFIYSVHWVSEFLRADALEYLEEATSPNGTYTVTAYLCNYGATTDYTVLCTVTDNQSGKTKDIYSRYHCQAAYLTWLDDERIDINGVELNVRNETYFNGKKKKSMFY
jgi:hypothetical protein